MTFKGTVNKLRRDIMRKLTENIGTSHTDQPAHSAGKAEITRVLISRPNHRLGNLLLITPLLQEISETLPHAKIDLFVKGNLAPSVFKNYDNIDRIIQLPKKPFSDFSGYIKGWLTIKKNPYDIVINVIEGSHQEEFLLNLPMRSTNFLVTRMKISEANMPMPNTWRNIRFTVSENI